MLFFSRKNSSRINSELSEYVVFDLETTGRSVYYSEIIQISAIHIRNGKVIAQYNQFVKPLKAIPEDATAVNHITNEMVANAPSFSEMYREFIDFIEGKVLVGYNISTFDLHILSNQYFRVCGRPFSTDYVDVLLAAYQITDVPDHKLSTIASYFGIDTDGAHNALCDCLMTDKCYRMLVKNGYRLKESPFCGKQLFSPQFTENTKAIQILREIMTSITQDGEIDEKELFELSAWMKENQKLDGTYPFCNIKESIIEIMQDGVIEKEELESLTHCIEEWLDPVTYAKHSPIVAINGRHVVLTGDFEFGTKEAVERYIESKGAIIDANVKKATELVVVGSNGSSAWAAGNYGNKIKSALERRSSGQFIEIVREKEFFLETKNL